jgi:hypothetical protein
MVSAEFIRKFCAKASRPVPATKKKDRRRPTASRFDMLTSEMRKGKRRAKRSPV